MPVIRDERGQVTAIVCGRAKPCAYCERAHTRLCDFTLASGKTCDTPMCSGHAWQPVWNKDEAVKGILEQGKSLNEVLSQDYCRVHRRKIEGGEREENRKAELAAKKRDTLIFIACSKFSGYCKEKDCSAKWAQGDPMYWDSKTRETFCSECGEMMQ